MRALSCFSPATGSGTISDLNRFVWGASAAREDLNADINEGHISTAVVHVANISQRLGKPASAKEIQQALEALKVNENVVETFVEIRQHLSDNGVDIEKTPLTLGPSRTSCCGMHPCAALGVPR